MGLSQHRLGKKVGVSRISINKIETEKAIPNFKLANDIANELNTCIYKIFDLDGEETYCCNTCNCDQKYIKGGGTMCYMNPQRYKNGDNL